MSDIKELKEKDLTDEVLEKVTGGDVTPWGATCPRCGNRYAYAFWNLDTGELFDFCCDVCGLGLWS